MSDKYRKANHRRHSSGNDEKLAAFVAATAEIEDTLDGALSEVEKCESALREIARLLKAGGYPAYLISSVESSIEESRATAAKWRESAEGMKGLRALGEEALGLKG